MDIEMNFTYHPPKEGQPEKYVQIRSTAGEFGKLIERLCPESRERGMNDLLRDMAVHNIYRSK